jgi:3-oxoacyl-[acyl-carrier protein] reductase
MELNLTGKKALVCGSTQGIGKATALELAMLGASVTLVARDEKKLKDVLGELAREQGQTHDFFVADFDVPEQVKNAIERYLEGKVVHILVNNTAGPPAGTAIDATVDEFMRGFASHLLCSHVLVQAVTPGMKREKYGRIINIVSTSVKIPLRGLGVSNTVRGAVANWSKTLSIELAPYGITVNNILPGSTKTGRIESLIQTRAQKSQRSPDDVRQEMIAEIPAGRMAEASEIGVVAAFLATPAAGYVNGANIPVDGGRTGSL